MNKRCFTVTRGWWLMVYTWEQKKRQWSWIYMSAISIAITDENQNTSIIMKLMFVLYFITTQGIVSRATFLVHPSRRLKCTIVITCCPSSVHLSSVVNFSHFLLLLWNCWIEFNETWQEARSQRPLPSLCFSGRSEKTRWPLWSLIDWDIFDFFSETTEWNSTKLDRKQDLNVLYQVCVFLGRLEKQDGRPGLWLAETFSTSSLKSLNRIQRNLTGSKISTSSTKFVFFEPIGKTRWPPWPLIGWDIFHFFS